MTINSPRIIKEYIDASNQHDIKAILSCFSDDALVRDEREEHHGKKAIEGWIVKTIEKYQFQFRPLEVKDGDVEVAVAMEVSGTFDGSPVTLDYHFSIANGKIVSLSIH